MKMQFKQRLPQGGTTRFRCGESPSERPSSEQSVFGGGCTGCPSYSGVGKNCSKNYKFRSRGKRKNLPKASPSTLSVDFTNVRGLNSNLNAVHFHLETAKPALFFLTETQISFPADTSYLSYPGYKLEHSFVPRAGVCVYVREDICSRRLGSLEGRDLSSLWLRVDCDDHPRFYACLFPARRGSYR
ncbi:unnamed protein product [Pieris brassicae]|uniref:Uncharacterized protein n=1 Tax=Pieris brassicae TaxID=7116 RepID=A0A9P0TEI2_PIEBR|nr:unnamed protein product [Pieris brassicae]